MYAHIRSPSAGGFRPRRPARRAWPAGRALGEHKPGRTYINLKPNVICLHTSGTLREHWGNTNRVVSNRVVSKGPLYPSKTKIIIFYNNNSSSDNNSKSKCNNSNS